MIPCSNVQVSLTGIHFSPTTQVSLAYKTLPGHDACHVDLCRLDLKREHLSKYDALGFDSLAMYLSISTSKNIRGPCGFESDSRVLSLLNRKM